MSDYENMIEILSRETKLTHNQIKHKIQEKKEKIGAGYLTDQGAMFLIASDYKVNLSEELSKPITIKFDELHVPKISKDDLENKFKTIKSEKIKKEVLTSVNALSIPLIFILIIIALSLSTSPDILFGVIVGIIVSLTGYLIYFYTKKPVPTITLQEEMYLKCYVFYKKISQIQYRSNQTGKNSFISKVGFFADYIDSWTEYAPTEIIEITKPISNNLHKKIIPIIKNNETDRIMMFLKDFEKFVMFCYDKEPTIELLTKFGQKLEYMPTPKHEESITQSYSENKKMFTYTMTSPVVGIIVGITMYLIDSTRVYDSWGYGFISGIMVFVGVLTMVKRKNK